MRIKYSSSREGAEIFELRLGDSRCLIATVFAALRYK